MIPDILPELPSDLEKDLGPASEGMGRGRYRRPGEEYLGRNRVPGDRQRAERLTARKLAQGVELKGTVPVYDEYTDQVVVPLTAKARNSVVQT